MYVGLLVSLVLPTVPPWLASTEGALSEVDRIVRLTLLEFSSSTDTASDVVGPNAVAAMPSLHLALTELILPAVWRGSRAVRAAAIAYTAAMGFPWGYGAEHYGIDLLAGGLTAAVVRRLTRRLAEAAGGRAGGTGPARMVQDHPFDGAKRLAA